MDGTGTDPVARRDKRDRANKFYWGNLAGMVIAVVVATALPPELYLFLVPLLLGYLTLFAAMTYQAIRNPALLGQPLIAISLMLLFTPTAYSLVFLTMERFNRTCVDGALQSWDYIYFSYVTITTLGYGDMRPVGICKGIAASEAIVGLLLIGLVASSVTNYVNHHSKDFE